MCAHKIENEFVTTTTTITTTIRSMTAVDKYRIGALTDQATSYTCLRTHNHIELFIISNLQTLR